MTNEYRETPEVERIEIKSDRAAGELIGYEADTGRRYTIRELESMAETGGVHAQCALGDFHSAEGESFDPRRASIWYEKAAKQGHTKAQGLLAGLCITGMGTKKDIEKAEFWARKSAAQNSPTGMSILSNCCITKDGFSGAVYWLEKAIELGYPDADATLEGIRTLREIKR